MYGIDEYEEWTEADVVVPLDTCSGCWEKLYNCACLKDTGPITSDNHEGVCAGCGHWLEDCICTDSWAIDTI